MTTFADTQAPSRLLLASGACCFILAALAMFLA